MTSSTTVQIPGYLANLAEYLAQEQATMLKELTALSTNIEHIKQIISMQQSLARFGGLQEPVTVTDVMEQALAINLAALERQQIKVVREYTELPKVLLDRHQVLLAVRIAPRQQLSQDEGVAEHGRRRGLRQVALDRLNYSSVLFSFCRSLSPSLRCFGSEVLAALFFRVAGRAAGSRAISECRSNRRTTLDVPFRTRTQSPTVIPGTAVPGVKPSGRSCCGSVTSCSPDSARTTRRPATALLSEPPTPCTVPSIPRAAL